MAKIIIEVSDDFIRQNASDEALKAKLKEEKVSPKKWMYDVVAFKGIEKQLEKGVTEFRVSRDELTDKRREIFDTNLADVLIVARLGFDEEKETNEN